MRKAQKKQAEEFVELLGQVHNEIKKAILAGNTTMAQELLGQCQQGAIELGNLIEKTEGEGFVTVSYLEKYCEIVYSIYQELGVSAEINAEKLCKHLNKELLTIKNSIKNDIPLKNEIVFFPYKASMWDSLESVYLAAKEDPNCDAYCVPIPYFDKNPDGSFGQIHYEGREYPKNIEVIDWQTYNLEERRPDVVYIHNPYDEYNYVTSVHPRFYSSNLKKYTDELVYIPYFVLEEVDPENESTIAKMRHFCLQPGVFNANKVILQSEAMAQIYINEYIKAAQAEGVRVDKQQLKKKYLGLGSPKLEKVKNSKKENLEIPDEWMKIIRKPDGSLKKIVFYNTGITALLDNDDKMLEKIQAVFTVFEKCQEEIALLWRPHPLIANTIKAMRMDLWIAYERIVNEYKNAGWGIYDDTADMNRAVMLSNAYYGDASSVVELYQKTGKPVMLQECSVRGNENVWSMTVFTDGIVSQDKIWTLLYEENELYTIDVNTGEITYIDNFTEENCFNRGYSKIMKKGDDFFLLPWKSRAIVKYNYKTKEKSYIPYKEKNGFEVAYNMMVEWNDDLYFLPQNESAILKYDKKTNNLTAISLKNCTNKEEKISFAGSYIIIDNKLILPSDNTGEILIYDFISGEIFWKTEKQMEKGFLFITTWNEKIYLIGKDNWVYQTEINLNSELKRVYCLRQNYRSMKALNEKIYMVPDVNGHSSNKIAFLDLKEIKECFFQESQELKAYAEKYRNIKNVICFDSVAFDDKNAYFIPRHSNALAVIDLETNNVVYKEWKVDSNTQNHLRELLKRKIVEKTILDEKIFPLEFLVDFLVNA